MTKKEITLCINKTNIDIMDYEKGSGRRVLGPKSYGITHPIKEFTLTKNDLENFIEELKICLKEIEENEE